MTRVAAWVAWLGGLFLLWLALVGSVPNLELVAGVFAAAIAALAVEVVRSQGLLRFRVEWRWLRLLGAQLLRVVPDFLLLMAALPRRPRGSFRTLEFPVGGTRAIDAGRRAYAVMAASLAPNRLVVGVDPDEDGAVVHDLLTSSASSRLL